MTFPDDAAATCAGVIPHWVYSRSARAGLAVKSMARAAIVDRNRSMQYPSTREPSVTPRPRPGRIINRDVQALRALRQVEQEDARPADLLNGVHRSRQLRRKGRQALVGGCHVDRVRAGLHHSQANAGPPGAARIGNHVAVVDARCDVGQIRSRFGGWATAPATHANPIPTPSQQLRRDNMLFSQPDAGYCTASWLHRNRLAWLRLPRRRHKYPAAGTSVEIAMDVCSACTALFLTASASISDRPGTAASWGWEGRSGIFASIV